MTHEHEINNNNNDFNSNIYYCDREPEPLVSFHFQKSSQQFRPSLDTLNNNYYYKKCQNNGLLPCASYATSLADGIDLGDASNNNNNNHNNNVKNFVNRIGTYTSINRLESRAASLEQIHNLSISQESNGEAETNPNNINKSSYSLSELDNIKKQTINNLKNYKNRFKILNNRVRTKIKNTFNDFNNKQLYFERLIRKNGDANINRINIERRRRKYVCDLFNTLIDMKWRSILLLFALSFLLSWTGFAFLWFLLPDNCIANMGNGSFWEALLFSIETQQTIGYGSKYVSKDCTAGLFILMVQCGFSVILESLMGGIVFAKLSRPKKRTETLIFSRRAVIAPRDGVYTLMCRVGDIRKSHIINAFPRMFLIRTRITKEGEVIPWNMQELNVENNSQTSDRLIFMPIIVEHIIDETSPLYKLISFPKNQSKNQTNKSARRFKYDDFEIIAILEGTVESTGQATQARSSYLPSEILWNHVFEPLIDITPSLSSSNKATIDFSKFNNTIKLDKIKKDPILCRNISNFKLCSPTKCPNTANGSPTTSTFYQSQPGKSTKMNGKSSIGSGLFMSENRFTSSIRHIMTSVDKINENMKINRKKSITSRKSFVTLKHAYEKNNTPVKNI